MKVHEKIITLSLIILCANGIIGYKLYTSNQKIVNSEKWVRHTEEVISESARINSLIKNVQIAILSNKGNGLTNEAVEKSAIVFEHIKKITKLTENNPSQQIKIDSLAMNIHKYIDYSLQQGKAVSGNTLNITIESISHKDIHYIKRINALLTVIQNKEYTLLIQRKQTNKHNLSAIRQFNMIMYISMTIFIFILLIVAGKYLYRIEIKQEREDELLIINKQLALLNKELADQNCEKGKRAAELVIANTELAFQNKEKEKRASELIVANTELAFQNKEKEKRASELIVANTELAFQNKEKEKRASELIVANTELAFQNEEKENRAAELIIANKELADQNCEKGKRAAELVIANTELAFQNEEKEKRASELVIANTELAFQNGEKENRASELTIANKELAFQNSEKEKRAVELTIANQNLKIAEEQQQQHINGLEEMMFMTSHRVRQPVTNILGLSAMLRDSDSPSEQGQLIDGLEKSASYLDIFTKELTSLLNDLQKIGR